MTEKEIELLKRIDELEKQVENTENKLANIMEIVEAFEIENNKAYDIKGS